MILSLDTKYDPGSFSYLKNELYMSYGQTTVKTTVKIGLMERAYSLKTAQKQPKYNEWIPFITKDKRVTHLFIPMLKCNMLL